MKKREGEVLIDSSETSKNYRERTAIGGDSPEIDPGH